CPDLKLIHYKSLDGPGILLVCPMRSILFGQKKPVVGQLSARPNITAVFVKTM
ncbi:hypothetical protein HMPREF3156_01228, partial [Neisseria sp. HMSC06F02]